MARTFRHIPFHCRYIQPWEKSRDRLNELGFLKGWEYKYDPRDKLTNGYDNGRGQSYYFPHYGHFSGCKDRYSGDGKKFVKREWHRLRRRADRRMIDQEVWE